MVPTKERNHSAAFVSYKSEGFLIDCGEGTQRQLKIAGIPLTKITKILISHWHGDHVLGLPGLLQSMTAMEYPRTLHIYGPKGTEQCLKQVLAAFKIEHTLPFVVHEVKQGKFVDTKDYYL